MEERIRYQTLYKMAYEYLLDILPEGKEPSILDKYFKKEEKLEKLDKELKKQTRDKNIILPVIVLVISIVLGVASYFILPEMVITQFPVGDSSVTKLPKLVAILIPFALSAGGAIATIFGQGYAGTSNKGIIVSVVGIAIFFLMLAVNR